MARHALGYLSAVDPLLLAPQYPVFSEGTKIGRDADVCDVIIASDFVSRHHCVIAPEGEAIVLLDGAGGHKASSNGTFVNGEPVTRHVLSEGDAISCGRPSPPHFVYTRSPRSQERTFLLARQENYRIGRLAENDLPLLDDPTVSGHHAGLRIRGGALSIYDAGSANGLFVNGEQVSSTVVRPQDIVRIGSTELTFVLEAEGLRVTAKERRNQVSLRAVDIHRVSRGHTLLHGINLDIEPGAFVGVLGPSGAGKSTLLNALNGFIPANSGDVLLNGASLYRGYDMFRNSIGYVPQDDIIHRELTVERSLLYTAQLRLPRDYSRAALAEQVNSVIETLGLTHVRHNFVDNLSGGQRKRVSIGCELLTRPSLLFLDEPTSGLDPSTEEKLMHHFRRMSEQGQTVILTTHILYNLQLLDKVVLLSRGRLVYYGPTDMVCPFFSTPGRTLARPIEVFDILEPETADSSVREERAEFYAEKYQREREQIIGSNGHGTSGPIQIDSKAGASVGMRIKKFAGSFLDVRQLGILVRRSFDLKLSFPARLGVPMVTPILLALLTATLSVQDIGDLDDQRAAYEQAHARELAMMDQGGLVTGAEFLALRFEGAANLPIPMSLPLLMVMTAVFLGTVTACLEISGERPIYLRERSVNLSIPVYVASKLPSLFLMTAVQCFLYILIAMLVLGIRHVDILSLVLITTAVAWVSCTIGLLISSMDPTSGQNSVVLAVIAVLPQLIFSGGMEPDFYGGMSTVTKTLASILPARWGFELMLTTLYEDPAWVRDLITGTDDADGMGFRFGREVFTTNMGALAALGLAYFSLTCIALKRYDRL